MENNNLPNPDEQQEEEKKKKGLFGWFFRNNARAKWGTGVGRGTRSLSAGSGLAGKAGQQASLLAGRGGAGLGAGARAGGGFFGRFFGGGFARIFGSGGTIAQFLATKAGMAVAGLLMAAMAVGAAVYYNSNDGQTVNVASVPGEGFSPSGQSSSYPMPKDNMFGDDSFLNDSVPSAGSQGSSASGYGSGASGMYDGSAASGEGEGEGVASDGDGSVGVGGGASGTSAFGGGSADGMAASGSPAVGGSAAKGSAANDSAAGNSVSVGAGSSLTSGQMARYRRSATLGNSPGTVQGARGSNHSANRALDRSLFQSMAGYTAAANARSLESAAFTGGNAFENQDDVDEMGDVEVDGGDDDMVDVSDNIGDFTIDPIDPFNVDDITPPVDFAVGPDSRYKMDQMVDDMNENVEKATIALEEVVGVWEKILAAGGPSGSDALGHYSEGTDKVAEAISHALEALDSVEDMILIGGMNDQDSSLDVTMELVQRLLIVSSYLTNYWLPNAMKLAYPNETCKPDSGTRDLQIRCYDLLGSHDNVVVAPSCKCYDNWWKTMKDAQIKGGPGTFTTTKKKVTTTDACGKEYVVEYDGVLGSPSCADVVKSDKFPEILRDVGYNEDDKGWDEDQKKLTELAQNANGCLYKRYLMELDTKRIRREMNSCNPALLKQMVANLTACNNRGGTDCYGTVYGDGKYQSACPDKKYYTREEISGGKAELVNDYLPKPTLIEDRTTKEWLKSQCGPLTENFKTKFQAGMGACPTGKSCSLLIGGIWTPSLMLPNTIVSDSRRTTETDIKDTVDEVIEKGAETVAEPAAAALEQLGTADTVKEDLAATAAGDAPEATTDSDQDQVTTEEPVSDGDTGEQDTGDGQSDGSDSGLEGTPL